MKQFEPPAAPGPNGGIAEGDEEEEWTEAMRLMDAEDGGGGLNLQIGRTLSLQNSGGLNDSSLGQEASLTLYLCVLLRRQPLVTTGIVCNLGGDKFVGLYLPQLGIEIKCVRDPSTCHFQ